MLPYNHNYLCIIHDIALPKYLTMFCPIPRTRTPTGGGIQRSGSNLAANNRTSNTQTTTAYGADGSRVTTTRTSSSYSSNAQNQAAQQATRNW